MVSKELVLLTYLIFIVSNPHNDTGMVSKATDCLPYFLFNIGKKILQDRDRIMANVRI